MRRPIASVPQNRRYSVIELDKAKNRCPVSDGGKRVGKFEIAPGSGQARAGSQVQRQFVGGEATQLDDVSPVHSQTLSRVEVHILHRAGYPPRP